MAGMTDSQVSGLTRWTIAFACGLAVTAATPVDAQSELRGRVLSDAGVPIPGATVTVSAVGYSIRTDSLGAFRLAGTPGSSLALSIRADGFVDDTATVVLARGRAVVRDFRLARDDIPVPAPNPSDRFVRGRVTDSDGGPLAWANIQVNGGRQYVSNDSGHFNVPVPGSGGVRLIVRRIGFEPVEVKLDVVPDTLLALRLASIPTALPEMRVTGRSPFVRLDMGGFYRRMQDVERGINRGYFITPEELELRRPVQVTSAVEHLPNIKVRARPGARFPLNRHLRIEDSQRCALTVYVDRVRVSPMLSRGTWIDEELNALLTPTALSGIEVYPRQAAAPPDFAIAPGTCGLVLIWTR